MCVCVRQTPMWLPVSSPSFSLLSLSSVGRFGGEEVAEGAEHMMCLCQSRKKGSCARVPNGIFKVKEHTVVIFAYCE